MTANLPAPVSTLHCNTSELEALATALADCARAADSARHHAGLWADGISQDVEARLGTEPGNCRNWTDPHYAAALDALGRLGQLQHNIAAEVGAAIHDLVREG